MILTGLLYFGGGPGPRAPRSLGHLWDLGHVALFGSGTLFVMRARHRSERWAKPGIIAWVLAVAAALAVASELLQIPVHRSPEIADAARDLLGTCLALAFGRWRQGAERRWTFWAVRVALLLALGTALLPLATSALDEQRAARQFPLLGDFESPLELGRWAGSADRSISPEVSRRGRHSLRVELGTEPYSGIALQYFPEDWSGFRALRFQIYIPDQAPLWLTCRVHDAHHRDRGQAYADRFNRRLELAPGWNDVVIDLADVLAAPRGREMDLARIDGLGLFAVSLPAPRTFYLDDLRLER